MIAVKDTTLQCAKFGLTAVIGTTGGTGTMTLVEVIETAGSLILMTAVKDETETTSLNIGIMDIAITACLRQMSCVHVETRASSRLTALMNIATMATLSFIDVKNTTLHYVRDRRLLFGSDTFHLQCLTTINKPYLQDYYLCHLFQLIKCWFL